MEVLLRTMQDAVGPGGDVTERPRFSEDDKRSVSILAGMLASLYPYFYASYLTTWLVFIGAAAGMYAMVGVLYREGGPQRSHMWIYAGVALVVWVVHFFSRG